MYKVCKC